MSIGFASSRHRSSCCIEILKNLSPDLCSSSLNWLYLLAGCSQRNITIHGRQFIIVVCTQEQCLTTCLRVTIFSHSIQQSVGAHDTLITVFPELLGHVSCRNRQQILCLHQDIIFTTTAKSIIRCQLSHIIPRHLWICIHHIQILVNGSQCLCLIIGRLWEVCLVFLCIVDCIKSTRRKSAQQQSCCSYIIFNLFHCAFFLEFNINTYKESARLWIVTNINTSHPAFACNR